MDQIKRNYGEGAIQATHRLTPGPADNADRGVESRCANIFAAKPQVMITFTPQQLSRLNQTYNQAAKERFVQQTYALWQENFARLMPDAPALPEPAIQKHLDAIYENCLRHGVLDRVISPFLAIARSRKAMRPWPAAVLG